MPSVDDSPGMKLLPFVLSTIAGRVDVIGFLGLGGLFTARVTGNVVILAAKLVAHNQTPISYLIAVPVFMIALGIARLLVAGLERFGICSLLPLLFLQAILLFGFLPICLAADPQADSNSPNMIFAAMVGVSAMAVQNALARISIRRAPATAVMSTNITVFIIDIGDILFGKSNSRAATARDRAKHTWPTIAGYVSHSEFRFESRSIMCRQVCRSCPGPRLP
jgi:uncharacterized membrane protein YoaK (UPF0700 family)